MESHLVHLAIARVVYALVLVPAFVGHSMGATPMPEDVSKLDCGVSALFLLLRMERREVSLDRVLSLLPERHASGYSMAEIISAANRLGVTFEGLRIAKGIGQLTRPAILYAKDARGGHFVLIRPVGTTGRMLQVIDPPHPPLITDYENITKRGKLDRSDYRTPQSDDRTESAGAHDRVGVVHDDLGGIEANVANSKSGVED